MDALVHWWNMAVDASATRTRVESMSMAIVEAIAAAEGVDPADLDVRLGDFVDPEAVDALSAADVTWRLEFEVRDHAVEVSSDGTVVVDGERRVR